MPRRGVSVINDVEDEDFLDSCLSASDSYWESDEADVEDADLPSRPETPMPETPSGNLMSTFWPCEDFDSDVKETRPPGDVVFFEEDDEDEDCLPPFDDWYQSIQIRTSVP